MGNTEGALKPANVSTKQRRIAELARTNPKMAFTSLNHHLDEEWLRYAYELTRKDGATGVDGRTAADYEANLEENLRGLLGRIKSGRYYAPPVRAATIPKADGTARTLGIPTFEDKVAQRAIVLLLEPLYEQDFLPCSYGFRPGRSAHQALRDLRSAIMERGLRWLLDVDLRTYFDTIEHGHLRTFLARRVADGVVRTMIDKWLKAGVLDEGQLRRSDVGTPQGGVISPLLANVYLHYVLDEWFAAAVGPRMKRRHVLVRFCDDFVLAFEDFLDGRRVFDVLSKRVGRFGLALHPDKTRLVDFRFRRPNGRHAAAQATTFDFLGFTHVWGKSRRGKNVIYQRTAKARYARALRSVHDWCKKYRHRPVPEQHRRLCRMMLGHYAYYGITGNGRRLRWYAHRVECTWRMWLSRRTRGNPIRWDRFTQLLAKHPLPRPRIVHRYAAPSESAL
jgi:group II intron reverse transcriptase/maturase